MPEELKRKAVVAVASGRLKSREAAAELGVEASVVRNWKRQMLAGSKETHVARERRCLCSMVLRPVERLVFSPKER